jgi:hypothetical protein
MPNSALNRTAARSRVSRLLHVSVKNGLNSPTTESQPRLYRSLQSNRGVIWVILDFSDCRA